MHAKTALEKLKASPRASRQRVGSKNDAVQQRWPERRVEVDLLLPTCAQESAYECGCILGEHDDEPVLLGRAIHAVLMSWWLCMAVGRNLGAVP